MGSIMGARGFEYGSGLADQLIFSAGGATYSTTVLPGSWSVRSLEVQSDTFTAPWYNGTGSTVIEPVGDEFWFMFRARHANFSTANNLGVASGTTEFLTLSVTAGGAITLRLGGTVVATSVATISILTWYLFHVHVEGLANGDRIRVYRDGNLSSALIDYTLTAGNATTLAGLGTGKPNRFYGASTGGFLVTVDDMIAYDPGGTGSTSSINLLINPGVKPFAPSATVASSGVTGSHTDIDEVPPSDTDKVVFSAVGSSIELDHADAGYPIVLFAQVLARITRSGTVAGANMKVKTKDSASTETKTQAAPGDGYILTPFNLHPGGSSWSESNFNSSTFVFEAET
jgi:hypothetical protein